MKKLDFLREKYHKFVYENYSYKISKNNLEILFNFKIEPNPAPETSFRYGASIYFQPKVIIENINKSKIERVGDRVLNNLIFHLGLMEIPSYWKATCSPEILIEAGPLSMKAKPSSPSSTNLRFVSINQEQIKYPSVAKGGDERRFIDWWKDLIMNGMGQFFYENKIDFTKPNFFKISPSNREAIPAAVNSFIREDIPVGVLVPIGGGKDSVVTLELLKEAKKNIRCFSLNPTEAALKIMEVAGCQKPIIVRRVIDRKLLELNRRGFLNGHTPFSAYLAFLSVLVATIFDYKYIAFSNERSSNEGNVKYLGRIINHQWSKSFEFEEKFRYYSQKYLTPGLRLAEVASATQAGVEYFGFLRPLYEIQIARLFSKYSKYFSAFLSCNEAYKTASGTKKPTKKWCGKCPKCLFVFAILYPFVNEKELLKIFGKNLFEDKSLLPIMQELIGERAFKPFECVGTKKESLIVFYLAWKKNRGRTSVESPVLLRYFKEKILPKYPNLEKESKKILNSWNYQHNLSREFEKILRKVL